MTPIVVAADAASVSAPVVFILLVAIVILLVVRTTSGIWNVPLSRVVWRFLDVSVIVTIVLYAIVVYARFKIIG
ncbi:MAG: hypothetical protein ACYCRG_00115 [Acidimicrobiales bacterium]